LDSGIGDQAVPGTLRELSFLPWSDLDALYRAVVQGVEEAVLNCLVAGRTMIGRDGHRSPGLPIDRLVSLLQRQG
jgi:L-aminopeptidase/D-esterase-like protein